MRGWWLLIGLVGSAGAAPLFPDLRPALLERGKNDRALTRFELAREIARLLQQEHRPELLAAARELRPELEAMGIRVDRLTDRLGLLEQRVQRLEGLTFYGSVVTRATALTLVNSGRPAADLARSAPGAPAVLLDYNAAVGSALGAGGRFPSGGLGLPNFNPFNVGVLTTTNWANGRPLENGVGFTTRAILGLKAKLSEDIEAGMELAAYTGQGNTVLDAYYGVSAPYLSNPFTDNSVAALNQPFARMTLDHFWLTHKPSQTRVVLGAFHDTQFSSGIYSGMINPNLYGPTFLDNFGFQVRGQQQLDQDLKLDWEVMATRLPDGNLGALPGTPGFGESYWSHAEGLNARLSFDEGRGQIKLNALRAANQSQGGPVRMGLLQVPNLALNWVNPSSYFGVVDDGIGGTYDRRPIPMNVLSNGFRPDGSLAALGQVAPNFGGIGPQQQFSLGLAGEYHWEDARVSFQWDHSHYRPNQNSQYSSDGNAFLVSAGASLWDKSLELDLSYLRVDANYDPFIIMAPSVGGIQQTLWRTPDFNYFNNLYSLHDTRDLPQNRQGLRAKLAWKFTPQSKLNLEYSNLLQVRTSLQDVRYSVAALGPGNPNTLVLGQLPGYIEPVFGGFSPFTFDSNMTPRENPRGKMQSYLISAQHRWDRLTLMGSGRLLQISRPSQLSQRVAGAAGLRGEDVNHVEFSNLGWRLGVEYDVTPTFKARAAYTSVDIWGHYDPAGVYAPYAEIAGTGRFRNLDITQSWPELGFTWKLSETVTFGMEGRYYTMRDHVPAQVLVRPSVPSLNVNSGAQAALYSVHPFNWQGIQLSSEMSVRF